MSLSDLFRTMVEMFRRSNSSATPPPEPTVPTHPVQPSPPPVAPAAPALSRGSGGLMIGGIIVPVAGLNIIPPFGSGGPEWCQLHSGDYTPRKTTWVRQVIVHTTGGNWPQPIRPGGGNPGHAKQIADMWRGADRGGGEKVHSAAQIIVDFDGSIACLCDLARIAAYHAEGSNGWSIGIEMSTMPDGSIYSATLDATVMLLEALTLSGKPGSGLFPIPSQIPKQPYKNQPLLRIETGTGATRHNLGGPDCVGVFGHRDNTSNRGFGDPGDEIFKRLIAVGFEAVDFDLKQDIALGRQRQAALNAGGESLTVDGIVGPASISAMRRHGFSRWRDVVAMT